MAESDTKVDPAAQAASAQEPKLAKDETQKVTTGFTQESKDGTGAGKEQGGSVTDKASNAASAVKENVFSMFGGGPKKEKKEEEDDVDEPSGSSKKKAGDVGIRYFLLGVYTTIREPSNTDSMMLSRTKKHLTLLKFISSPSCISPRKSKRRQMRSSKSRLSRCAPSCSNLTVRAVNGRSAGRAM